LVPPTAFAVEFVQALVDIQVGEPRDLNHSGLIKGFGVFDLRMVGLDAFRLLVDVKFIADE